MTFWKMDSVPYDTLESETLCEEHALREINWAMGVIGSQPFGSMAEAKALTEAMSAMAGQPFGLTDTDGPCALCEQERGVA